MNVSSILPIAAAILSLMLAFAGLLRKKPSFAAWSFFAGMLLLAAESVIAAMNLSETDSLAAQDWLTAGLVLKPFSVAAWLAFSLTYSRGDYRQFLRRWTIPLALAVVIPIALALGFSQHLLEIDPSVTSDNQTRLRFTGIAKLLNIILLVTTVWIVMNVEQTFRAAVGTMRWRIKFVVLGLTVIFGARLYVGSQALLFSVYDAHWPGIESSGLLIGCLLLAFAYARTGWAEIDVYPSRTVLRSSLTVLIAGGYLFIVGVLANLVRRYGGAETLQFTAFVVLLGAAGLGVLLLSDRLRQQIHDLISRHFSRAQHDSVRIWTAFSRRLAHIKDQAGLCDASARLLSETFQVLSVTIWLADEAKDQLAPAASTAPPESAGDPPSPASSAAIAGLRARSVPFDLEEPAEPWAEELRRLNPSNFPNGGNRWCVPLRAGDRVLGTLILADRVRGVPYSAEELQLLQCIADQITSVLLNLRLAQEVARARELEAFRTMSAFFVHDLKNAASSLNLMLQNLPVHFDDPAFREDALRGIGNTARRIDEMIGRLTALRQRPAAQLAEADLNQLIAEVLDGLPNLPAIQLNRDLQPLPSILADREQIRSVVANLVLNARDAVGPDGRICVCTEHQSGSAILTVTDNGCGMSPDFLQGSLFRPFQSTKKKGLGIGLFQSRMIVEAHGGTIRAESQTGQGSTFRVCLPLKDA